MSTLCGLKRSDLALGFEIRIRSKRSHLIDSEESIMWCPWKQKMSHSQGPARIGLFLIPSSVDPSCRPSQILFISPDVSWIAFKRTFLPLLLTSPLPLLHLFICRGLWKESVEKCSSVQGKKVYEKRLMIHCFCMRFQPVRSHQLAKLVIALASGKNNDDHHEDNDDEALF